MTAQAQEVVSQTIDLAPGWNIVSTPMVLTSHTFSTAETSENFDIYLLDASKPSGWATMADLGQTEFAPLYGYFINNKTDEDQTLTFNYDTSVEPNHKLFERTFGAEGWYSIGVANASYAKTQSADRVDTDNPSSILSLLEGKHDTVIDFTDDVYGVDRKSVALSDPWKAVVPGDIDELNDFRDTKGYVVYIKQSGARYNGFQNDAVPEIVVPEELHFSLGANNPEATTILVDEDDSTDGVTVLEYTVSAQGGDIELDNLWVNLQTETANLEDVIDDVSIYIDGAEFNSESAVTTSTSVDFQFAVAGDVVVYEGESVTVEVVVDFKPQLGNYASYGETVRAQVTEELVGETLAYGIDEQVSSEYLTGDAIGGVHSLLSGGIIIPVDSIDTQADTLGENDTIGEFTIEFEVTAVEDDFYITDNTALVENNPTDGVGFLIEGGEAVISSVLTSTADEDTSGVYTIQEGETETFTLTVTIDPTSAGNYRVTLAEVWYSAINNGITSAETYIPNPASDYRTSFRSINAD